MAKRQKEVEVPFDELDDLSTGELIALCKRVGYTSVHPLMSKDEIIDVLLGQPVEEDPVEEVRDRIAAYVRANRRLINRSLLNCNLQCPTCPVMRVTECYTDHKDEV